MLHKLILGPIELFFDVIFALSMQMTESPVISIVIMSLAFNLLVLPLYRKADMLQKEENEIAKQLKPDIDHIKSVFTGDQRFMTLQSYYRKKNYKPYYVLRGSLSLLLQIPFFMAAYNFLSNLSVLRGVSFGPIADLSKPDGMLTVAGVAINVLPILMTLINLASGFVYSKELPLKSKIQMYGITLVFLVLLYNSPAGLVFYWILNNLFSLFKNILRKLPQPKKILCIICSGIGLILGVYFILHFHNYVIKKSIFGIIVAIVAQIPLISYWINRKKQGTREDKPHVCKNTGEKAWTGFISSCVLLTVLTGLLIPSAVIHASPAEFVELGGAFNSPLIYILHAFLFAAGTFMVWCVIYYLLTDKSKRHIWGLFFTIFALASVVNYMFFGSGYGNMTSTYVYDSDITQNITTHQKILNMGILCALAVLIWFLWKKKVIILRVACIVTCLVITGMSLVNVISVANKIPEIERLAGQEQFGENRVLHLNKKGRNVVVLMLDRAYGYFAPFIFEEKPELKDQYNGFVCYTNALSYGHNTNMGAPALFGGYEYTPEKINARTDILLKDKHNEALRLMPLIFLQNGFEVTVCDPPLANYEWIPDLKIYDDYPEIRTYLLGWGRFDEESDFGAVNKKTVRERNLFCYSVFRASPVILHSALYDGGNYNKTDEIRRKFGFSGVFSVLKNLGNITRVQDDENDTFLMLTNNTTHEPVFFQEPGYEQIENVDNSLYDSEHPDRKDSDGHSILLDDSNRMIHYQTNMAALIQIGKWMDYLREQGVYDNTRIIIAADHGTSMGYPELISEELDLDIGNYIPLFLVKDFSSNEPFSFSNEFMTNADTPTIAFSGLIENPVNPATNQPVTNQEKSRNQQKVGSTDMDIFVNNGTEFSDTKYYYVEKEDVLNPVNWSVAE